MLTRSAQLWFASVVLAGACRGGTATSSATAERPRPSVECSPHSPPERCFPLGGGQRTLVPPIVVGPGRIRVVTPCGLVPDKNRFGTFEKEFTIEEITLAGRQLLGAGQCPGRAPSVVGVSQLASGASAVLCLDDDGLLDVAVVERPDRPLDWRWRLPLVGGVPFAHLAELGGTIAVIHPVARGGKGHRGGPAARVVFGPDGKRSVELGGDMNMYDVERFAAVAIVDGKLRIILPDDSRMEPRGYYEQVVSPAGDVEWVDLEKAGKASPGRLISPCTGQDLDGSVTVSLPYRRDDLRDVDYPGQGRLTIRYPRARLLTGPDVFPSDGCPPPPPGDREGDVLVRRSSLGRATLVVSEVPAPVDGTVWYQRQPGSLRIERGDRP